MLKQNLERLSIDIELEADNCDAKAYELSGFTKSLSDQIVPHPFFSHNLWT